jgi:hypothetical protein
MRLSSRLARSVVALTALIAIVNSCDLLLAADDTKPTQTAAKQAADKASQPSEEQCRQWAALFVKAMTAGDVAGSNNLIDWDALLEKATAYPNLTPAQGKQRGEFIGGAIKATKSSAGFCGQVIDNVHKGGTYKLLRCREVEGQRRALLRMITADGGLNYHDFVLASRDGGVVRAVDCYVFLTGQLLTEAVRQAFLPFARTWSKGGLDQLAPDDREFLTHFSEFTSLANSYRDKEHRRVLETYKRMPESLKKLKNVLAIRLNAAQQISDEENLRAIDDFRKYYPNDASVDLIALDAFMLRKAYDQVLAGLDRVDKAVGGDPYLKGLRANALMLQGKTEAAVKMAEAATAEEPTLQPAYVVILTLSLDKRDFAKTAQVLSALQTKCGLKFQDLTTVPEYKEFVKSPQYKAWLKSHQGGGN